MPVNSMYLYTIFNFKGKIKGAEGAGVGGWCGGGGGVEAYFNSK